MAANSFNTSNESYKQLLSGGSILRIPRFQRDYSWKEEHWEDLWSDLLELLATDDDPSHYMGYLVLQPKNGQSLDVIDGQQRLTTLSILILAAMRRIQELILAGTDPERNKIRIEELRRTYIGQLDPVSLVVTSKLTLNRNNDHYYQTFLTTLRDMPSRGFKTSEHSMRKATDWFYRKVKEYLRANDHLDEEQGAVLAGMIDKISRGLFFTKIVVDDELNAYKVFETLNARGVKLSAPDLLKNFLFSVISREADPAGHDAELDAVENRWSDILERLQSENVTTYLRTYWGANNSFVRESDLFKVIKRSIETREQAYRLIRGLEEGLETYLSLTNPDQSEWAGEDKENARLLKMFSVRQPLALLMAMKEKIPDGFSQVLRGIVSITFRYNVISNLQAAEQERVYSRIAIGISQENFNSARDVLLALRPVYPNDEIFRANFASKTFDTTSSRNKQIVKYILGKLDAQRTGNPYVAPPAEITIEHILPESPNGNWPQFTDAAAAAEVFRIGNMTLLEAQLNRDAGNREYQLKRDVLSRSGISTTANVPERYQEWSEQTIADRQTAQANVATAIWRVAQYHE
ncbi:DUF262 domain-containing protein [Brucella anthropi]|uniref:DUF262 domain-containing protein n=1 Tax=Brucella anthropi TaxID=529 RepID=A0A6L3YXZ5_BRUAN|nr:DUF262 domain-containing protein [Brucella anthropi]KAB2755671.1 DUF262 domain-containing protein [Brucella anthropi]UVV70353.1 DUF262 domain-containing HNH endonuclease family protein [Brucella anthropi]